jgi:biotin carboxyl carrier protein
VAGEEIRAGKTIGLLEVMKTFSPIKWIPAPGNPQTAVVGNYRIADGDDVEDSQPLLNLDPSS